MMYVKLTVVLCGLLAIVNGAQEEDCFCWTKWLDRDDPTGTGDYETLPHFQSQACDQPVYIQCQTTAGLRYVYTGDVMTCEPRVGGFCRKKDQQDNQCEDYEVRFLCQCLTVGNPQHTTFCGQFCWTDWLNRDAPSGKGDFETLHNFLKQTPPPVCPYPVGIQCRRKDTKADYETTGQKYHCEVHLDAQEKSVGGGHCVNDEQESGENCDDYEVRFLCPCD